MLAWQFRGTRAEWAELCEKNHEVPKKESSTVYGRGSLFLNISTPRAASRRRASVRQRLGQLMAGTRMRAWFIVGGEGGQVVAVNHASTGAGPVVSGAFAGVFWLSIVASPGSTTTERNWPALELPC